MLLVLRSVSDRLVFQMSQYCIKIAKFLPNVETVHRADIVARRFWIRGSNGKVWVVSGGVSGDWSDRSSLLEVSVFTGPDRRHWTVQFAATDFAIVPGFERFVDEEQGIFILGYR